VQIFQVTRYQRRFTGSGGGGDPYHRVSAGIIEQMENPLAFEHQGQLWAPDFVNRFDRCAHRISAGGTGRRIPFSVLNERCGPESMLTHRHRLALSLLGGNPHTGVQIARFRFRAECHLAACSPGHFIDLNLSRCAHSDSILRRMRWGFRSCGRRKVC
jgi:hypothetical protein